MDGWDMIKGGVYKKRKVDREGSRHKYQEKKRKQEEHLEKKEWTVIILM